MVVLRERVVIGVQPRSRIIARVKVKVQLAVLPLVLYDPLGHSQQPRGEAAPTVRWQHGHVREVRAQLARMQLEESGDGKLSGQTSVDRLYR